MNILKKKILFIFLGILVLVLIINFGSLSKNILAYYSTTNFISSDLTVTDIIEYTPTFCFEYKEENEGISIMNYKNDILGTDKCPSNVVIPKRINGKTVKKISSKAFDACDNNGRHNCYNRKKYAITSLTTFEGLETIDDYAFTNNLLNGELEIPSSVKTIGNYAFGFFQNTYWTPERITSLVLHEGLESIGNYAFFKMIFTYNSEEKKLEIPSSVKTIGDFAFANGSLGNLILHEGLESIGEYAFARASINGTLEIPASLKIISKEAFGDTEREKMITSYPYHLISGNQIEKLILHEGLEIIEDGAFDNVYLPNRSSSLEIPSSVKIIGDFAFCNSVGGETNKTPQNSGINTLTLHEGLESIGNYAFNQNLLTGTLEIPSSVKKIGNYAFYGSTYNSLKANQVEKLILHEGLESIGEYAFASNKISGNIKLVSTIKNIQPSAFAINNINGTLEIPQNLKKISDRVFYQNKISSLILHEGLEEIGYYSFIDNSLGTVEIPSSITILNSSAFDSTVNIIRK
jgi:hypothetical protein